MPEATLASNLSAPGPAPIVVEVVRCGVVESRHRGSMVLLDSGGSVLTSVGDVTTPCFPRSSNKPLQAVAMLRAGLELDDELLALAAASHSGETRHVDGVRRILAGAGLDESHLRTPPDWPLDVDAMRAVIASGGEPAAITMNCSGKHAAMLATCVAAGWSTDDYVDPDHPLQVQVRTVVGELGGEDVACTAVDGCGAPLFALSLTALARAFRMLVLAPAGSPERRIADAMRAHPLFVGGTGRDVTELMTGVPGLLAKDGAEAVYAATLPDGRALALKIEDGGQRARVPLVVSGLRALGVDAPALDALESAPLLGGGRPVGEIRAVPDLF